MLKLPLFLHNGSDTYKDTWIQCVILKFYNIFITIKQQSNKSKEASFYV